MKIVSLGEILWDVFSDAEYLGGAPFNFAAHAHRLGHEVFFVSAIGRDRRGALALERLRQLGLSDRFVGRTSEAPTGIVPVNLDSAGQPHFTIERPAAYDCVSVSKDDLAELSTPPADWIYFGTLHQTSAHARDALASILEANPAARRFYDVNLRANSYDRALVERLLALSNVVKLNDEEAAILQELYGEQPAGVEAFARRWAERFGWQALCVTRGAAGCAVLTGGEYAEVAGFPVPVADTVGAGDAFSAAFVHGLASGWRPAEIGECANRVGALVASRRGAIPDWSVAEAEALRR